MSRVSIFMNCHSKWWSESPRHYIVVSINSDQTNFSSIESKLDTHFLTILRGRHKMAGTVCIWESARFERDILVNDVAISPSEETKFLVIIVDDKLSFSSHVDLIISKCNSPCTKRGPICSQHTNYMLQV